MTEEPSARRQSPYLLDEPPTSTGRVLLARALSHYCALEWGFSPGDIAAAFDGEGEGAVQARVRIATRIVGETLARGAVECWTRPLGGGDPARLKASAWERDDFSKRFATSGCDPQRPFDAQAQATHWIFLDLENWNALVEALVGVPHKRAASARPSPVEAAQPAALARPREVEEDRLVRLDEVKRRTGLSRSTIYRRMDDGLFPQTVPMSGSVAAWREREVDQWVADPR